MRDRGALARTLGETEILWLEASERYETAQRATEKCRRGMMGES